MAKKRVFISCGQDAAEEKALGTEIKRRIDACNGMEGFFAQNVHSPEDLNRAVFKALQVCDGFFGVMHRRGEIHYPPHEVSYRASVWIQQEIAILCYRMFVVGRHVPVRVYYEKGIRLEGLMRNSIINPIEFETKEQILEGVSDWLQSPEMQEDVLLSTRESLFRSRTEDFKGEEWLILQLIVAHCFDSEDTADHQEVLKDFVSIVSKHGEVLGEKNITRLGPTS